MAGFRCPYVPGGMPRAAGEAKVMAELGRQPDNEQDRYSPGMPEICSNMSNYRLNNFSRLGSSAILTYLTLKPQYEQGILEIFAELVGNGLVYKQLKPIHWSVGCETALADAELEYKDIVSASIFVNFPLEDESSARAVQTGLAQAGRQVCFMIWTTTPWTLAANLAVALHPSLGMSGCRTSTMDGFTSLSPAPSEAVLAAAGCRKEAIQSAGRCR